MNAPAVSRALEVLHRAASPIGFTASLGEQDNYRRVWTRDGVITGLAALESGDLNLRAHFRTTLETLFNQIARFVPSNVAPNGQVSYGGTAGRADNPSWAVIGLAAYTWRTGDLTLWEKYRPQVDRCFELLEAWEFNGKHLIYVPQSGDWADEYIGHGYLLFDQLLRLWALRLAGKISNEDSYISKAKQIESAITVNYARKQTGPRYTERLASLVADLPGEFWLMGFNPARVYRQFDLQANALALLLLPHTETSTQTLNYMLEWVNRTVTLLPSFSPVISGGDWEMEELRHNFAFTFRNKPHEFHNGGLWPVWNGFMALALRFHGGQLESQQLIERIHLANTQDFNECFHGETGQPVGVPFCTWSAAGSLLAETQTLELFTC